MSILLHKEARVITQGITGQAGSFHTRLCRTYGTNLVAGVTPGKGGGFFDDLPLYDTVQEAVQKHQATATMIFVPPPFCADAILEAVDAGLTLIVVITEGIPVLDMVRVKTAVQIRNAHRKEADKIWVIGPNGPGLLSVDEAKIGIMPAAIHSKGPIGVVSRSGTLTYEAVWQLTNLGIGQSTVVGIGGDPVAGTNFIEVLSQYEKDPATSAVLMIGEIGGRAEEEAALFHKENLKKPLFSFIAGQTAPKGKRMGHAGAIVEGASGTAADKIEYLKSKGVVVVPSPTEIGQAVKNFLSS